jgi:cell wall-associated NlpC family hydrolase
MTITYDNLLGLEFKHGSQDCYSLVRAFYKQNYNLDFPDIARPDDWWDHGLNLYMDHFKEIGFDAVNVRPQDLRIADGFLMAVYRGSARLSSSENKGKVANHSAVYIGDGKILHHMYGRLSSVENYTGMWFNTTVAVLRHKDVPIVKPVFEKIDLMTLLPPNKRAKLEAASKLISS